MSSPQPLSIQEDVGGTATALALNKATNQVAIVGRSLFKIYNITEKQFELATNLRVAKGATAGCNDVAWNQVDGNLLATASPNGAVVIWNLSKTGYSKIDHTIQSHKRIVNKVHFHSTDPNLLVSGSQDSIKLFDLRQSDAVISFTCLSEPIRDLQFSPHRHNTFIAVQDNGYVQLYDIRKRDKFEQCFPAHNGPIFACDWQPEMPDTVATAGRDMNIKVWSLVGSTPSMQYCIPSMESVSKVRWSLDVNSLIASCSLKRDYSINVWDIHRPYIASARFTEPQEITVGMAWRQGGLESLISITSSGTLFQLPLRDAYRPLEHANPVGMAINPDGDIALALGNGLSRLTTAAVGTKIPAVSLALSLNNQQIPENVTTPNAGGVGPESPPSQGSSQLTPNSHQQAPIGTPQQLPSSNSSSQPTPNQTNATNNSTAGNLSSGGIAGSTAAGSTTLAAVSVGGGNLQGNSGVLQQNSLPIKLSYQASSRHSVTRRSQDSALIVAGARQPRISSRSQLDVYKCMEMNWFVKTAQEYKLSDRPLAELCDHNAEVCAKLRRFQICQTWKILKLFYANVNQSTLNQTTSANFEAASVANGFGAGSVLPGLVNQQRFDERDDLSMNTQVPVDSVEFSSFTTSKKKQQHPSTTRGALIGAGKSPMRDSFSLDHNCSVTGAGSEQSNESTDDWISHETLPYEAFQLRRDLCGPLDKLLNVKLAGDESPTSSASSNHEDDGFSLSVPASAVASALVGQGVGDQGALTAGGPTAGKTGPPGTKLISDTELTMAQRRTMVAYQFKFYEIIADVIADALKYHVDNSDVQSAVSILIVLGDRIKNIVNERISEVDRESWYYSYIDLLSKFQLWNVMAQVINLSPLSNINSINQTSTTIYTVCGTCNRPLNGRVGWICDRCKTKPSECSLCHGVVAGLMAWCHGCYHGGHLVHMNRWFAENDFCPTGCGHMCELGRWH